MSNKYISITGFSLLVAGSGGLEYLINKDLIGLSVVASAMSTAIVSLSVYAYRKINNYKKNFWKYKQSLN